MQIFSKYDCSDDSAECQGFIMIDDVQVFGTFEFTFDAHYDQTGYPEIVRNVKVTAFTKGGVDLVPAFNDADVWCSAEDSITDDLKSYVLVPDDYRDPDQEYMAYIERHHHN